MSQKNETPILILALLVTAGILGGGYWLFTRQSVSPGNNSTQVNPTPLPTENQPPLNNQSLSRISSGNTILVTDGITPQKKAGVEAFSTGNFAEASTQFQSSLQVQRNDPETLIYLNNAQAANHNPLKIAAVVPIGGNLNVAQEILRGVAQAQNQLNQAGGIQGRWLQVVIANDDNNPEISPQIANQLVNDSSILAVIGHGSSDATMAAASVYNQGQLVAISPTSDAKAISGISPYVFRTIPSVRFQADALSRYTIRTANKKNMAICFDSQAKYSQSLKEDFTSAILSDGGKVIEINCDFSAANFNALNSISQAISQGADSLLLIPAVNKLNSAIEIAQANQQRLALLGSSTLYTFQTLKDGQGTVNGMVFAVPWHPEAFAGNAFPQQAKRLWGGEVNWRSALAYDATEAIITGLKQGEFNRQALQETLSSPNFSSQGATGNIQFLPSGDRNAAVTLVKIIPGQKSGTGFDFVPLKNVK